MKTSKPNHVSLPSSIEHRANTEPHNQQPHFANVKQDENLRTSSQNIAYPDFDEVRPAKSLIATQPPFSPLSAFLPATAHKRLISDSATLAEVLRPQINHNIPAVFLIENPSKASRNVIFSNDFMEKHHNDEDKAFGAISPESRLGFVFPNGTFKEFSISDIKEKEPTGYLLSTLFNFNAPLSSLESLFEQKVLLTACLHLGWISTESDALAKGLLIELSRDNAFRAIQDVFHESMGARNQELVDLMIEWGADVNFIHPDGNRSPLQYARFLKHTGIEQSLLEEGAELYPRK